MLWLGAKLPRRGGATGGPTRGDGDRDIGILVLEPAREVAIVVDHWFSCRILKNLILVVSCGKAKIYLVKTTINYRFYKSKIT
jgi:hypothetical protein